LMRYAVKTPLGHQMASLEVRGLDMRISQQRGFTEGSLLIDGVCC